ncbi:MAG TPA: peptidylprolyl isomerase [Burkholderiales bacterium]|nr:peptidylprolyl isomerase [Burkholderiales bacterium]
MKAFLFVLLALASSFATAADPRVELKTNRGNIVVELYPEKAPRSVANFLQYVKDGHYNGVLFHRVIDGFMIQTGGFDTQFQQKPTRPPIQNEADNGLPNDRYTVSMARLPGAHTGSSQFFINTVDNAMLNFKSRTDSGYGYAVFGKVVSGMEVVDRIAKVKTGRMGPYSDVPIEPVVLESATLLTPPQQ